MVLDKGLPGSTYTKVLEGGIVAAVKRLNALQFLGRSKAFDRHVLEVLGRSREVVALMLEVENGGDGAEPKLEIDVGAHAGRWSYVRVRRAVRHLDLQAGGGAEAWNSQGQHR